MNMKEELKQWRQSKLDAATRRDIPSNRFLDMLLLLPVYIRRIFIIEEKE
jgi:hypothetical protein